MADDGASSITVAVRVRPFTIKEAAQLARVEDGPLFLGDGALAGAAAQPRLQQKGLRPIIKVIDDRCLVFDPPEDNPVQRFSKTFIPQGKQNKDQTFAFDKVFDENISQGDVYEATTKSLLDSVLNGYNATVFAYGATGCGKTHTITGNVQQPGIIFLTMQELFERITDMQEDKVTEVSLSYLEIYNETIRDLLVPGSSKGGLMLREDANQAVSVSGLSSHHPQNVGEVMDMIVRGNEYRTMSPTEANATSSRSHAVLQINVSQKDRNADISEPHTMATLSIIDLAGSERASATKNRGERLAEGANINKSLLALGSCINALCDPRKKNHVPYRNSKLTRLLKFSLGGNCKTVMIVCVSPSSAHFDETQNTLRYANRAKNIQTKVTRNVFNVNRHVKDFLKKIDEQIALINELKAQQKDMESICIGKLRKQSQKKDGLVREGLERLRLAYQNSAAERQERIACAKKLRQIEARLQLISLWSSTVEQGREELGDSDLADNLATFQKTAVGIQAELEQSRAHCHHRLTSGKWHRSIDHALELGVRQLEDADAETDFKDKEVLQREAELLKCNSDRETQATTQPEENSLELAAAQVLLKSHLQTLITVSRLQSAAAEQPSDEISSSLETIKQDAIAAMKQIVKPDITVGEAFPPTKSGTPKFKRTSAAFQASPMDLAGTRLPSANFARMSMSPVKASPRRRAKFASPRKGVSLTPRKKASTKRVVRWKDDVEDGRLAEWSETPPKDAMPTVAEQDETSSSPTENHEGAAERKESSAPTHAEPSSEIKPKRGKFQAGFLSRKTEDGSPNSSPSTGQRPLGELSVNEASGRHTSPPPSDSFFSSSSPETNSQEAKDVSFAIRRASLSRAEQVNKTQRRRSPTSSSAVAPSPAGDNMLFTAGQARRMVKSGRESSFTQSVLSPRATPIGKTDPGSLRRLTMSDERAVHRGTARPARLSSLGPGTVGRGSLTNKSKTAIWR